MNTELKGCKDCKHYNSRHLFGACNNPEVAGIYEYFDHKNGKIEKWMGSKEASEARDQSGKCKREAIYFEPTRYYRIKQWLKQLLK